jgi:16S rRNA (uracil1498-N3)-methyltransferase
MARRLFFVDEVRSGRAAIAGEDARHLTRVLRVEAGQKYEISDNESLYLAEVELARKEHVVFRVVEKLESRKEAGRLVLLAALIKFDRFETILEKATELGASEIVPVQTVRSERGLERAALKRMERWRRIVLESSQQSRRPRMPELREPLTFERAAAIEGGQRLLLDETPGAPPILSVINARASSSCLLTGPEGGWTPQERSHAIASCWLPASLGPNVLRTETAVVAALAIIAAARQLDRPRPDGLA